MYLGTWVHSRPLAIFPHVDFVLFLPDAQARERESRVTDFALFG
jgi:hypothetical protein